MKKSIILSVSISAAITLLILEDNNGIGFGAFLLLFTAAIFAASYTAGTMGILNLKCFKSKPTYDGRSTPAMFFDEIAVWRNEERKLKNKNKNKSEKRKNE